jgi:hypothetical protein
LAITGLWRLHTTVTTIRRRLARLVALTLSVRAVFIGGTQVTLLGTIHGSITAVPGVLAIWSTTSVFAVVDAVVTLFSDINHAISALDSAMRIAVAEHAAVIGTIVALLASIEVSIATGV